MALESGTYISDLVVTNPPGSDPKSTMDDHLRLMKATLKNSLAGFTGAIIVTGTDGGAVNAYTLTPANALPAYGTKMTAVFAPTVTNTGACTLNISALGVKNLRSVSGDALVAGDLVLGSIYAAFYTGTEFRLLSVTKNYADQLAFGTVLPAQTGNAGKFVKTDGTTASWASIIPPQILRSARTSNTILATADSQKLIDITSGTFTQTFDAAATLADGWFVYLRNSGTGDITLDPNGAELIDGLTSYIMYPGEVRLVQCDGTALRSVVVNAFYKTFTSSGTFTKPPGYALFSGLLWSGGNSGSRHVSNPRGGGGGGCAPFSLSATVFGATETITIGAGGAPYTGTLDDTGNVGGLSSIGSLVVLTVSASVDSPSKFGVGLGTGWDGGAGSTGNTVGTSAVYGGAGGSGFTAAAGTSKYGGNGGLGVSGANGTAGTAPGGGGGGSVIGGTSTQSGAGARGELRIWGTA